MNNKEILRASLRKKRTSLSHIQQQQKSQKIVNHVLESGIFKKAQKIGYYHAVRGEADPANLSIGHKQQQFYLPVVVSASENKQQGLVFAPALPTSQHQPNQFNIPEPICEPSKLIQIHELDLLIMPLLGFDKRGNRLGMGGGFYDRSLSYKQQYPKKKPVLIGFAYDFQEIESLQAEPWDIGLEWIAKESGLFRCK